MDPLQQKLKALKPDEPDDEIAKDLASIRQQKPGITDDEILQKAQALVQGGGKPPAGPPSPPQDAPGGSWGAPGGPGGSPGGLPPIPFALPDAGAPPAPSAAPLAAPRPDASIPTPDKPEGFTGHDAAMAALQGLAGLGDAIGGAYGGNKTDFLKTSLALPREDEAARLKRSQAVAETLQKNRGLDIEQQKADAETKKASMEGIKAQLEAMKKAGKDTFDMEEKLRDGFSNTSKTYSVVRDQYGILQAAAKDPSAAGDLALIFAYMKMVDPGSSVREGEFANAQNSAGVPDRIMNLYNNALTGQRFDPKVRADFVDQAKKLYSSQEQTFKANKAQYDTLADSYGLSKDHVTGIVVGAAAKPGESGKPPAPAAGEVPTISSQEEYDRLPSGAEYLDPQGQHKRKK